MIIKEQIKDTTIIGDDTSKKAGISADKMAKLQYLLTKGLYKDPITAVIAEWTNNGIDSIVQANKDPKLNPVIVSIGKNEKNQFFFSVEDKGIGLDNRDFEDICMNYLESTKEGDNDTIGHFGIGMKSFLSLDRSATFTCRKNGVERVYIVYEGAEFVNYDLVLERDTTEENGVKAELIINDASEYKIFSDKAKQKLAYYDTAVLVINNSPISNTIHRNELFQYSTQNSNSYMHLCLKDVYYQIDWEALGIAQLPIGIALRFDLSSGITPTPSRESYISNENTKKLIMNRVREVAEWFVNKYNENVKEYDNLIKAYDEIGNSSYNVHLPTKSFNINCLISHTNISIKPLSIKGISLRSPSFYKNSFSEFLGEYSIAAQYTYGGSLRKKRFDTSISRQLKKDGKIVLINEDFRGNVKEFLMNKYGVGTIFIKRKYTRKLGVSTRYSDFDYRYLLNLSSIHKSKWREHIKEWQYVEDTIRSFINDETNVENTEEFAKFVDEKKQQAIERRKQGIYESNYIPINKKQGEVTLAYSYKSRMGISFRKEAYKIENLLKNKFVTILIKKEEIDKAKPLCEAFSKFPRVKWALVGPNESRKIPQSKQFLNFSKVMTIDFKPFMRIASSILFDRELEKFNTVFKYKNGILANCLLKYKQPSEVLTKYVDENLRDIESDSDVASYILSVAEHKDLFDKFLWEEYLKIKEAVNKYDFITCLTEPAYWDDDAKKKYDKIISQLLLFRKKYYDEFPENARIVFDEVTDEEAGEPKMGEFDELLVDENELETV